MRLRAVLPSAGLAPPLQATASRVYLSAEMAWVHAPGHHLDGSGSHRIWHEIALVAPWQEVARSCPRRIAGLATITLAAGPLAGSGSQLCPMMLSRLRRFQGLNGSTKLDSKPQARSVQAPKPHFQLSFRCSSSWLSSSCLTLCTSCLTS